ncbi:hypothetical protein GCM10017673_50180 [Streptosporangium violaceochromogenes]|nr:hypothetical protein GCM10017673_50180 [Streptosporangium violaceochromogenes]
MVTQTTTHAGCRVCRRTDVQLKGDQTLRVHVRPDSKGSPFLLPGRCPGAGHPPRGVLGAYAQAVLKVLAPHFPDLANPITAGAVGEAVQQHRAAPGVTFGLVLDASGDWRLRARRDIRGHVRCAYWGAPEQITEQDCELVEAINAELDALPGRPR